MPSKLLYLLILLTLLMVPTLAQPTATVASINPSALPADRQLWNLETLSKAPRYEWLNRTETVQSLVYESVPAGGKPTQVFAYFSDPDRLLNRPPSGRKFPGVVLLHGGGGQAFREWVEKWAAEGYAALAMDLAGRDGNRNRLPNGGPDQGNEEKFDRIATGDLRQVWTYHAVASGILAHSLLLSMPQVDPNRTALTGISWGGYLTCIVASLDNRFKAAAPVYGCGFYDESDVFKQPLNKLTPDQKQQWMQSFDPSVYLPYAQMPFLFINGNRDKHYNVVPYHKTYSLIPVHRRTLSLIPDMRHNHPEGWAPVEIRFFFDEMLNKAAPFPRLGAVTQTDSVLSVAYTTPVALRSAQFRYSNDTTSTNENRVWLTRPARIDPTTRTIQCTKPPEGFRYGFIHATDHRGITSSSEFIINR